MNMIQAGAIGVAGVLLAVQFRSGKAEYGIYISIALSILIFSGVLSQLGVITETLRRIGGSVSIDTAYVATLLKMLGIAYIAEFASDICKDAGYQAIAGQIEVFGKLAILALSAPVLLMLLDTIERFLS